MAAVEHHDAFDDEFNHDHPAGREHERQRHHGHERFDVGRRIEYAEQLQHDDEQRKESLIMSDRYTQDPVNSVKADTDDLIDEAKNRAQATGERAKRTVAGGSMSPVEQIGSHLKEAGHELKAGIDKDSRKLRHDDGEQT